MILAVACAATFDDAFLRFGKFTTTKAEMASKVCSREALGGRDLVRLFGLLRMVYGLLQ
jgi:hypothetical protein